MGPFHINLPLILYFNLPLSFNSKEKPLFLGRGNFLALDISKPGSVSLAPRSFTRSGVDGNLSFDQVRLGRRPSSFRLFKKFFLKISGKKLYLLGLNSRRLQRVGLSTFHPFN